MKTTIGKLFDVEYGQKQYENKSLLQGEEGNNIIISSKGTDNGVYGFYNVENGYKAPIISVPRTGTIGQAFVQPFDCSIDNNCLVLKPKQKLSIEKLFEVAYQIRLTKWKYKYGRQITPTRLKEEHIILGNINVNFTELQKELTPKEKKKKNIQPKGKLKIFKLKNLFKVKKGKGSYLEHLSLGDTPIVSTQAPDCGVVGFYEVEPTFKGGNITIGRIMCNPNVQLLPFATVPDDVFVLEPLKKVDKEFLFYVSSLIKNQNWRFNYYRKATKKKFEEMEIHIPTVKGDIDYSFIKEIVSNSYGYTDIA